MFAMKPVFSPEYCATVLLEKRLLPVIVGSTATGKTALGIAFAQWLERSGVKVVVLSADSRLVYQGLNVGTAKPTVLECAGIAHEGMNLVPPTQPFTAQDYATWAEACLAEVHQQGAIPLFVGGTGFYLQSALCETLIPAVVPDESLRHALHQEASTPEGRLLQWQRLECLDPNRAMHLHPNDTLRVVRALEVIQLTGKPVPQVKPLNQTYRYPTHWFNLYASDKLWLWQRIAHRTQQMLKQGWLDEVEALVAQYGEQAHALGVTHGYPELIKVLKGEMTPAEAEDSINIQVRQYAKRQQTWFRRLTSIDTLDITHVEPSHHLKVYLEALASFMALPTV
jgi:tRNA dimethylallyltransferase